MTARQPIIEQFVTTLSVWTILGTAGVIGGCTTMLGDTSPPPIHAGMNYDELRSALLRRLEIGMDRDSALRHVGDLRVEPEPTGAVWLERDVDGLRAPYPSSSPNHGSPTIPGWRVIPALPEDSQPLDHAVVRYEIRAWYPRPPRVVSVSADTPQRLLELRFGPGGTLTQIMVGPAIGVSGKLYDEGFCISH